MRDQAAGMPGPVPQENTGGHWQEPPKGGGLLRQLSTGCFAVTLTTLLLERVPAPRAFFLLLTGFAVLWILRQLKLLPQACWPALRGALALSAALTIAFCRLPWLPDLVETMGTLWEIKALTSLVSAVGMTGVAFAWLVSAADREVLGVPIGRLIHFAYPGTYGFYCCVFLPQTALGIYAGNIGWSAAAVLSAMGVLLAVAHLLRVCYAILLNSEGREKLIYDYYDDQVRKVSLEGSGSLGKIAVALQATALCAREQLLREYRFRGRELLRMWCWSAQSVAPVRGQTTDIRKETLRNAFQNGTAHPEITAVLLMETCWQALLRDSKELAQRRLAIQEILLDMDCKEEQTKTPAELAVLAGLVLALVELHRGENAPLQDTWVELDLLLGAAGVPGDSGGLPLPLCRDLRIAFGMVLAVHILQGDPAVPVDALHRIKKEVMTYPLLLKTEERFIFQSNWVKTVADLKNIIDESGACVLENSREGNLELLLWYVEWATKLKSEPSYDTLQYQSQVMKVFLLRTDGRILYSPYQVRNLCYRASLLRCLADYRQQ